MKISSFISLGAALCIVGACQPVFAVVPRSAKAGVSTNSFPPSTSGDSFSSSSVVGNDGPRTGVAEDATSSVGLVSDSSSSSLNSQNPPSSLSTDIPPSTIAIPPANIPFTCADPTFQTESTCQDGFHIFTISFDSAIIVSTPKNFSFDHVMPQVATTCKDRDCSSKNIKDNGIIVHLDSRYIGTAFRDQFINMTTSIFKANKGERNGTDADGCASPGNTCKKMKFDTYPRAVSITARPISSATVASSDSISATWDMKFSAQYFQAVVGNNVNIILMDSSVMDTMFNLINAHCGDKGETCNGQTLTFNPYEHGIEVPQGYANKFNIAFTAQYHGALKKKASLSMIKDAMKHSRHVV